MNHHHFDATTHAIYSYPRASTEGRRSRGYYLELNTPGFHGFVRDKGCEPSPLRCKASNVVHPVPPSINAWGESGFDLDATSGSYGFVRAADDLSLRFLREPHMALLLKAQSGR